MEIVLRKSSSNKIFLPWLATTGVTIVILATFHMILYYLFYTDSKSLSQHFTDSIVIYIYAFIWPLSLVNSYKSSIVQVKHNGEVYPELIKAYFQSIRFELIEEKPGMYKLKAVKFWDKLFPGSRFVRVDYTDREVTIEMPFHQQYHVHHGFKFSKIFIKK